MALLYLILHLKYILAFNIILCFCVHCCWLCFFFITKEIRKYIMYKINYILAELHKNDEEG